MGDHVISHDTPHPYLHAQSPRRGRQRMPLISGCCGRSVLAAAMPWEWPASTQYAKLQGSASSCASWVMCRGRAVLVNRGWVPPGWRSSWVEGMLEQQPQGTVRVTGVVQGSEKPSSWMPPNDPAAREFHWVDAPAVVGSCPAAGKLWDVHGLVGPYIGALRVAMVCCSCCARGCVASSNACQTARPV